MLFKGRVLILKNAFPNAVVDEESRKLFIRVAGRWGFKTRYSVFKEFD